MFDDHWVVRGEQEGGAELPVEAGHGGQHLFSVLRVEVGRGLVGYNHERLLDQGPGDGHRLLLAAGQLVGSAVLETGQPHLGQRRGGRCLPGPTLLLASGQLQRPGPRDGYFQGDWNVSSITVYKYQIMSPRSIDAAKTADTEPHVYHPFASPPCHPFPFTYTPRSGRRTAAPARADAG
jgi:hypothetical protein